MRRQRGLSSLSPCLPLPLSPCPFVPTPRSLPLTYHLQQAIGVVTRDKRDALIELDVFEDRVEAMRVGDALGFQLAFEHAQLGGRRDRIVRNHVFEFADSGPLRDDDAVIANDPISAPAQLRMLESELKSKRVADPHRFDPILKSIKLDEGVPLIARNHA